MELKYIKIRPTRDPKQLWSECRIMNIWTLSLRARTLQACTRLQTLLSTTSAPPAARRRIHETTFNGRQSLGSLCVSQVRKRNIGMKSLWCTLHIPISRRLNVSIWAVNTPFPIWRRPPSWAWAGTGWYYPGCSIRCFLSFHHNTHSVQLHYVCGGICD